MSALNSQSSSKIAAITKEAIIQSSSCSQVVDCVEHFIKIVSLNNPLMVMILK